MSEVNQAIKDPEVNVEGCYEAQNAAFGPFDYPLLANLISSVRAEKMLDIGTGDGSFLIGLAENHQNVTFDAIDLNEHLIELARKKHRSLKYKINFEHANFGVDFSGTNYDLIMTRFALEHIKELKDIDTFLVTAHDKLKPKGWLVIIEYYIHDLDIDEQIWQEFRKKELAVYNQFEVHSRVSLKLPQSLKNANFINIKSSVNHISPATIEAKHFFKLASEYAKLYASIYPELWSKEFVHKIITWCDDKQYKGDPTLFTSHTIAQKG